MQKIKKYAVLLLVLVTISSSIAEAEIRIREKSDVYYGNFRNVRAGKIGGNNLFRSQHPANGSYRSQYANALAENNRIATVLNLSDSAKKLDNNISKYKIDPSYYYRKLYSRGSVYTADLHVNYKNPVYCRKVAMGLKFFTTRKGPYLVHCEVGRDRTGLVILLLECLMNAPYKYMVDDYAQSYINVNDYSCEAAQIKAAACVNDGLSCITWRRPTTDWSKIWLSRSAENYLKRGGMTDMEIYALKKNLSVSYPAHGVKAEWKFEPPASEDTTDLPPDVSTCDKSGQQEAKRR